MQNGRVTHADVLAAIAAQELADLAVLDGATEGEGQVNFYNLKKHLKGLRRCENGYINRSLDAEREPGYIASRDVYPLLKG